VSGRVRTGTFMQDLLQSMRKGRCQRRTEELNNSAKRSSGIHFFVDHLTINWIKNLVIHFYVTTSKVGSAKMANNIARNFKIS
jgi:hypothetical protein